MKWEGERQSDNIEDRRDQASGVGGFGLGGRSIGVGSVVIALVAGAVFGVNPLTILSLLSGGAPPTTRPAAQAPRAHSPEEERMKAFVATVLADTEDVWTEQFRAHGRAYRDPRLVLFRGATATSCGQGESAMGPFYCPADEKVYIDLGFYDILRTRLGAPGDFAQAYVIAHEVGHHVQKLLGVSDKVEAARNGAGKVKSNALSVRLELQADCYAGIWAHDAQRVKNIVEPGDIDEALNAASQIGDDTLQRHERGTVVPESFTHGTSEQRVRWFRQGYDSGDVAHCDTFRALSL